MTLSRVAHHARCGVIGLPLLGMLYVRKKDVPGLPAGAGIAFATKLEMAAEAVTWLRSRLPGDAVPAWVVVDGGYAKREFLKPAERGRVRRGGPAPQGRRPVRPAAGLAAGSEARPGPPADLRQGPPEPGQASRPDPGMAGGDGQGHDGPGGRQAIQDVPGDLASGRRAWCGW